MPKGRPKHGEWRGFEEVHDAKGKIVAARCHKCNETLAGHSGKAPSSHRTACLRRQEMIENENCSQANENHPQCSPYSNSSSSPLARVPVANVTMLTTPAQENVINGINTNTVDGTVISGVGVFLEQNVWSLSE